MQQTIIVFDGGTSCNIPRLGYGEGYGSYQINNNEIVRLKFCEKMSSNAAEINTITAAIESILDKKNTKLLIIGDSKIALGWIDKAFNRKKINVSSGSSPEFISAIKCLYMVINRFSSVKTQWHARENSVKIFGH